MTTFNLPSFPRRRESKFSSVTTEDDAWISACAGMTEWVGGFQNVKVIDGRYFSGKKAPKRAPAFTLVEILVVIVIIGIGLAIAVANLFVSDDEKVRHEALRLMALIEKTRDHAAFSGYAIVQFNSWHCNNCSYCNSSKRC